MASKINPTNVNGNYPVAGQDNNSQGFRDNFTSIRNNFSSAANEISDLQSKVILKSALEGEELNNDLDSAIIKNVQLQGTRETVIPLGTTSGTITLNYANASYFTVSTSGNITAEFTNPTPSNTLTAFKLRIVVTDAAHTLTIPSSVSIGVDNIRGLSANVITFDETGVYEFEFRTVNNGGGYSIQDLTRNTTDNITYWGDFEEIATDTAADMDVTSSLFTNSASETSTLVAGSEGQIKVFAKTNDDGDMTITVNDAGWKASGDGTVVFDTIGQSCTMLYVNGKWFCIGNNGATFS